MRKNDEQLAGRAAAAGRDPLLEFLSEAPESTVAPSQASDSDERCRLDHVISSGDSGAHAEGDESLLAFASEHAKPVRGLTAPRQEQTSAVSNCADAETRSASAPAGEDEFRAASVSLEPRMGVAVIVASWAVSTLIMLSGTTPLERIGRDPAGVRGSLVVRSLPHGGEVFMNDAVVGRTPMRLPDVPAGTRAVRIELDGWKGWSSFVQIVPGAQTTVTAELQRLEGRGTLNAATD